MGKSILPALLSYNRRRVAAGSGLSTVTFDLSDWIGGISTTETINAGRSTFKLNNIEQLTGTQGFGPIPTVGSFDESDNMPVTRQYPLTDITGTDFEVLHPDTFPIICRTAGDGNMDSAAAGSLAPLKWLRWDTRMATREKGIAYKALAVANGSNIVLTMYFVINEWAGHGSPFFRNGIGGVSGGPWSHEEFYNGLGLYHSGGNPATSVNDGLLYPGFWRPTVAQVVTNSPGALTGPDDTKTYNVPDTSGFVAGESAFIRTPPFVGATWKQECDHTPLVDRFKNGEWVIVKSKTATSLTVKQARMGPNKNHVSNNNQGAQMSTLATGGGSFAHPIGAHISALPPGQGSDKAFNTQFHAGADCPVDGNGKTYTQTHAEWLWTYKDYNGSGNTISGGFHPIAVLADVTEDRTYGVYHFDHDGNAAPGSTVDDENIIGNINKFREARDYALAYISYHTGLPVGGGGISETMPRPVQIAGNWYGGDFNEIENIASGEFINSEDVSYLDASSNMYRTIQFAHQYSKLPMMTAVLNKTYSEKYNDGDPPLATTNNVIHNKMAMCNICGVPFAMINYSPYIDPWFQMFAVETSGANAGKGIANTSGNQLNILSNLGWLGKAIGKWSNVSGVAFGGLTDRATYNYENTSTDDLGYGIKFGTATTVTKRSNEPYLAIENISQDNDWGTSDIRTPKIFTTADHGQIIIRKTKIACPDDPAVVRLTIGNTSYDRNMKVTQIGVNPIEIIQRYTPISSTNDLGTDFRQRGIIQISRVEGDLHLYYDKFYVGTGASFNPLVMKRDFEWGISLFNANTVSVTVPLNDTFEVIDMASDEQCDWLTSGQTVSGSITLPGQDGVTLYRVTSPNLQDEIKTYFETFPQFSNVSISDESVSFKTSNPGEVGNFQLYPHSAVSPVIT